MKIIVFFLLDKTYSNIVYFSFHNSLLVFQRLLQTAFAIMTLFAFLIY